MSPRPGLVLEVDDATPPVLVWHGEGFRVERLPEGSRILYPPEPLPPIKDFRAAVRQALLSPVGSDPLPALLRPGMKLVIAFDDVSLPLPPMKSPDVRQVVIEEVLEMAADKGIEDVTLIAALGLHRRMTEDELRHVLGPRVYEAFSSSGRLLQHDAEDPENLAYLGKTELGEDVEVNRIAAEADLLVYVNITLVAMDGGHKSVATGLSSYRSLRHHHNWETLVNSRSFMDHKHSALHFSNWRIGKAIAKNGVKVFQIETTLNNKAFPDEFSFLQKREWEWGGKERLAFEATSRALRRTPPAIRRAVLHAIKSPQRPTSVQAGEVEAVHEITVANVHRQQLVEVDGQTDVLLMGLPYLGPYNVNSIMNPVLVACLGLGYFFNMYVGKPLVREGGVVIISHPTEPAFDMAFHPSYVDFYENVLGTTRDPLRIQKEFEEDFATDPWYVHLYRTGHAYHGVHPFYMWYWCAHALEHVGKVILLGADPRAARHMGFSAASTLEDALEMARDAVGTSASITYMRVPPLALFEVR